MKSFILAAMCLALAACGGSDNVAENAVVPALNVTSEAPGDWSALTDMAGRPPGESGLLQDSPITVDLNALLGPDAEPFKLHFGRGTALTPEGGVLVSVGEGNATFLVLQPTDHAILAGLKKQDGWHRYVTPGADVPVPPSIAELLKS